MGIISMWLKNCIERISRSITISRLLGGEAVVDSIVRLNVSTAMLHQRTFMPYKNINYGKDVVVVATGPSLLSFKPIKGCVYIGINHAFLNKELEFDYYFALDYYAVEKVMPELNAYRKGKCVKFYGIQQEEWFHKRPENRLIPESDAIEAGALRFKCEDSIYIPRWRQSFTYDIASRPVGRCFSTVFAAMQFALWTNPRRIYIVGCDCSQTGHFFDESKTRADVEKDHKVKLVDDWRDFKQFAQLFYPKTEIVSVNPVGLKGLFKDLYQ